MQPSEATFQRCTHDRQNPYVMISREMAQDKSISPKAKGVLLYLFSLPSDWQIYHSQLQKGLGVGEEYINSAMDELLQAGYADRSRERIKGIFQPYKYVIREFKKCSPDRENQPGLTGPENPDIQSKHSPIGVQKKQQQQPPVARDAAVFSEPRKLEVRRQEVYESLAPIDIPQSEKVLITSKYSKEKVDKAVLCSKNKTGIVCLAAWLKGMLNKEDFEVPIPKEEQEQTNKSYAMKYDRMQCGNYRIDALSRQVEILHATCIGNNTCLLYTDKCFMEQFTNVLRKHKFPIKEQ